MPNKTTSPHILRGPAPYWWLELILGTGLIVGLIIVDHLAGWDSQLTRYYFDPMQQRFPLESSWLYDGILHDQLKKIPVIIGVLLLGRIIFYGYKRQFKPIKSTTYVFIAMGLGTGIVGLIRAHSPVACPWDLARYGGSLPLVSPWDWFQNAQGHCWPSGHASAGYCMLAFYFWLRATKRHHAWVTFAVIMTLGSVMGWAQIVRGAHFLSHVLWSLLICYLTSGLLASFWWQQTTDKTPNYQQQVTP